MFVNASTGLPTKDFFGGNLLQFILMNCLGDNAQVLEDKYECQVGKCCSTAVDEFNSFHDYSLECY